jgi:F-type H+-transporting ATPase subunit O
VSGFERGYKESPSDRPKFFFFLLSFVFPLVLFVVFWQVGMLEKVEGELLAFNEVLKKSPAFASFLSNPTINRDAKVTQIGTILEENKVTHITRNLFLTLSANGKIGEAAKVIAEYEELMACKRGVVKAVIISAEPLKKEVVESVKKAITAIAGAKTTVELELQVHPSIVGGLQVMVGDKFLDLSVNSRIADLSKSLEGV